ncbi:DnaJ C-terminal domain-containing protein [Thioclava sp.]|uniref:DnaJ C-terminal domain-containing protein n=1 Tax=Thioclava sp. TaxID=1933450 RepID=UPI003AA8CF90
MAQNTSDTATSADPYETLGVKKTATQAEIKKAYRKLVRTSHPDINPDDAGAEARFVKVSAAYDLLKDPETRARFDAGEIDASGQEKPQRQYYRDYADAQRSSRDSAGFDSAGFEGMDPQDIFAEMFRQRGGGGQQTHGFSARGRDLGYTLEVPFLDAARGGSAHITLPGEGQIDLKIPAGLRDGQTLRLRGKGGEGLGGGPRGDAQVKIHVQPHPLFRRDDDTILLTLPITLAEAVLGAKVTVPTIHGDVALSIPKGSSSGRVLRLRGRGVERKGKAGDQLVELRIVLPKTIDDKLTACIEEWAKTNSDDPREAMLKGVPR